MLKNRIILTPHQQEVYEKLKTWYNNSNNDVQSLVGYAGVGKTTMVSQLILTLIKNNKRVVILTFTNKALAVCRDVYSKYCGKDRRLSYSTIHSFFKLKPDYEITDEEISLLFGADSEEVLATDLVIVDEASQLSKNLTRLIVNNKTYGTKVLFMGDEHQLPPIEKHDVVDTEVNDLQSVKTSEAFLYNPLKLTEIIRQKNDNPILTWYAKVHSDLDGLTNKQSLSLLREVLNNRVIMNSNNQGIFVIKDFNEFKKMYMNEALDDVVMASFKRETSFRWNKLVHETLMEKNKNFCVGEPILIYKRWQGDVLLNNGEVATILHSEECKLKTRYYSFDVIKITTNYGGNFLILKDTELNYAYLEEYVLSQLANFENYTVKDKRVKLGTMYKLFDKLALTKDVVINLGYRKMTLHKTLDYAYGCTTHKLQGTTVKNVYLCLKDFTSCKNTELLIRLLYVAFSRAKEKVIIYE